MDYIIAILLTALLFVLLILLLAVKPSISRRITIAALSIAGISGLLIYGYGYTAILDNFPLAILRTLLAVCSSFVGGNHYGDLNALPLMQTEWMQLLCAFTQVCALYTTASAVISSMGKEVLKRLRLWCGRRGKLHLIYGVHDDALNLGRQLLEEKQGTVIFVADHADANTCAAVSNLGCVLRSDRHALQPNDRFLRRIGYSGKRRLTLYALSNDSTANIRYAKHLLAVLQTRKTAPQQLRLVILAQEEIAVSRLQVTPSQYGYGYVTAIDEPQTAARLLMRQYPPCDTVVFDADGRATENFEALIIGFGQVGQAVLRALVMNGQFEGSHFRADVFAPDYSKVYGRFANRSAQVTEQYAITFHEQDARSQSFYEYLNEHSHTLKYIVICTDHPQNDRELAEDLTVYFHKHARTVPLFICGRTGVEAYASDGTVCARHNLFNAQCLSGNQDHMAMILNHRYQAPSSKTALENWMQCDYFSRQSCRASADFIPAMLRAVGKTAEQAAADWQLTDAQLLNLSKTEHLRWCAFHYCMGFSPMSAEELKERTKHRQQLTSEQDKASYRISKNMQSRTHACLTDWDNLTVLSRFEAAVTGKDVDYQAMDTENVLAVPALLACQKL